MSESHTIVGKTIYRTGRSHSGEHGNERSAALGYRKVLFETRRRQRLSIPRPVQLAEHCDTLTLHGPGEFGRWGKVTSRTIRHADQQQSRRERGRRRGRCRWTADNCAFEMKRRKPAQERLLESVAPRWRLPRVDMHVDQPVGETRRNAGRGLRRKRCCQQGHGRNHCLQARRTGRVHAHRASAPASPGDGHAGSLCDRAQHRPNQFPLRRFWAFQRVESQTDPRSPLFRATRSHSSESDPKAPVDVPAFEGSPGVDGPSAVNSARQEK